MLWWRGNNKINFLEIFWERPWEFFKKGIHVPLNYFVTWYLKGISLLYVVQLCRSCISTTLVGMVFKFSKRKEKCSRHRFVHFLYKSCIWLLYVAVSKNNIPRIKKEQTFHLYRPSAASIKFLSQHQEWETYPLFPILKKIR